MNVERRPAGGSDSFFTGVSRAPLPLKAFAALSIVAELVSWVVSPSLVRGAGVVLAGAAALGIVAGVWLVWFGIGFLLLLSIGIDAVSGRPWYEIAWVAIGLSLLCWPSSWTYVNSGGSPRGRRAAEDQQAVRPIEDD